MKQLSQMSSRSALNAFLSLYAWALTFFRMVPRSMGCLITGASARTRDECVWSRGHAVSWDTHHCSSRAHRPCALSRERPSSVPAKGHGASQHQPGAGRTSAELQSPHRHASELVRDPLKRLEELVRGVLDLLRSQEASNISLGQLHVQETNAHGRSHARGLPSRPGGAA